MKKIYKSNNNIIINFNYIFFNNIKFIILDNLFDETINN